VAYVNVTFSPDITKVPTISHFVPHHHYQPSQSIQEDQTATFNMAAPNHLRFLDFPAEIREEVYRHLLTSDSVRGPHPTIDGGITYCFDLSILRVSRQIHDEARKVFLSANTFVKIETPWTEAQHHVEKEGLVPLIITGAAADSFDGHKFGVKINAPDNQQRSDAVKFVIVVQDIERFCRMWFYSALSYPALNQNLRLTLEVRKPAAVGNQDEDGEEEERKQIPNVIQRQFFEPFGQVKELKDVKVYGEYNSFIAKEMRDTMEVPYVSPEECLERSTKQKDDGNAELSKGNTSKAREHYIQAFKEIHVVCEGRRRDIWGDAFFVQELKGGQFDGHQGHVVRLTIRVKLVANMVQTYIRDENWDEAVFWGMRSINLMRGADPEADEDTLMLGWPGADSVGKIYFRTGYAYKMLDDKSEARKLFRVAARYLPRDEIVQRELASVALRLG